MGSPPLADLLHTTARRSPDRAYYHVAGRSVTYAEASGRCRTGALAIRARRWATQRIPLAASLENPERLLNVIWACVEADVSLAFLPRSDHIEETRALLEQLGAEVLVTDNEALGAAPYAVSWDLGSADRAVVDPMADPEGPVAAHTEPPAGGAFLLLTSGTAGEPRWVRCAYWQCRRVVVEMAAAGCLEHAVDQTVFPTCPLSHSYGLSTLLEYTHAGGTFLLPEGDSPLGPVGDLIRAGARVRVTAIEGVPYYYDQLANLAGRAGLPRLAHIGYGGGAIKPDTVEKLRAFWPHITVSVRYGLTETPSVVAHRLFQSAAPADWRKSGSVVPSYHVHIASDAGRSVAPGQVGEIVVESDCLGQYLGEPPSTRLATGDLGYLDRTGELVVVGRRSVFLKNRGFRLSPERIESALATFVGVDDCRVLMRDERLVGEVVLATEGVDPQAIRAHVSRRLPAYAVPDLIEAVQSIPRTATGKIRRH